MKNTFNFLLFLLSFTMISCQSTVKNEAVEKIETDVKETTAAFIANPQSVEEQTVKTLKIGQPAPDFKLPGIDNKFHKDRDFEFVSLSLSLNLIKKI